MQFFVLLLHRVHARINRSYDDANVSCGYFHFYFGPIANILYTGSNANYFSLFYSWPQLLADQFNKMELRVHSEMALKTKMLFYSADLDLNSFHD